MLEHILREGFIHRSCHFSTNTRNGLTISGDETSSIHWWLLTLARNPHYKKLNNSLSHSLPLSDTSFTHTHTHTLSLSPCPSFSSVQMFRSCSNQTLSHEFLLLYQSLTCLPVVKPNNKIKNLRYMRTAVLYPLRKRVFCQSIFMGVGTSRNR